MKLCLIVYGLLVKSLNFSLQEERIFLISIHEKNVIKLDFSKSQENFKFEFYYPVVKKSSMIIKISFPSLASIFRFL